MDLASIRDGWSTLFEQGGTTLWVIFFLSVFMWGLIVERYWFIFFQMPEVKKQLLEQWQVQASTDRTAKPYLSRKFTDHFHGKGRQFILAIQTITAILPMLGLLGTVAGMITVFDVITVFGTGNSRGMAAGISTALITTLAGLVTALSGVYFISNIESRVRREVRNFTKQLNFD